MNFYPLIRSNCNISWYFRNIQKNTLPAQLMCVYTYLHSCVLYFIFEFPFKHFSAAYAFKLLVCILAEDWNSCGDTPVKY